MTWLYNDPAAFTEDMLTGFLDANAGYVTGVPGGVVRAAPTRAGKVAVVVGGGSGHYPAFCGVVGPGFADGAVVGNIFTSPSAVDAASVARAAHGGAGVLLTTGNYAGDVMNFGLAVEQLAAEGISARYFAVTDDIASAPAGEEAKRRGIAGDFTVFKCASAAAEAGYDLDGVERAATLANDNTRTLGVAFDGCTLPGAAGPLFTVERGTMGLGLGIHGEPGVASHDMPTAAELGELLVSGVLKERPPDAGTRIAVILNGLGRTKYEELFVVWGTVAPLLRAAGYTVVRPEVGELVTSLDMAGCSLTVMWLDEELERLWTAPADTPAFRRGSPDDPRRGSGGAGAEATDFDRAGANTAVGHGREDGSAPARVAAADAGEAPAVENSTAAPGDTRFVGVEDSAPGADTRGSVEAGAVGSVDASAAAEDARECGAAIARALHSVAAEMLAAEEELGRIDAVAGDGDHGRGMVRGTSAATAAADAAVAQGSGPNGVLRSAGDAWAAQAGGTSGVLWGAALAAVGARLGETGDPSATEIVAALREGYNALTRLGKAQPGDKTMLDALLPFLEALERGETWRVAADIAETAAQGTASLRPRIGRARPLADRSVGSPDAGAVSLAMCVRTAIAAFESDVAVVNSDAAVGAAAVETVAAKDVAAEVSSAEAGIAGADAAEGVRR
ncbi:dihydroxyacetone kinase [Nocardia mexicana]|uniref:Dihydroxyacetone kinase n=1 Tax=Nocardia mexicana TaxID=279262 RepID=A0A370GJB0_9NOCA|nr:dihydroxyacetone kinase family protein [Nocardia mexicana]RDI42013.1 dihydroxyacetone kinase [Nocardia mexicana]